MKRSHGGVPVSMTHQWGWGRPPLSCRMCRQKKRRCDRNQPCSNCTQRKISCEYAGEGQPSEVGDEIRSGEANLPRASEMDSCTSSNLLPTTPINLEEFSHRFARLEQSILRNLSSQESGQIGDRTSTEDATGLGLHFCLTRFASHSQDTSTRGIPPDVGYLAGHLPPISEARVLLDHFAVTTQTTIGILHMPSARDRMEQIYKDMLDGERPVMADLLLLFTIFATSALASTPGLLKNLIATQEEATIAQKAYIRVCRSILEDPSHISPSTNALAAMAILARVITNEDGYPIEAHLLRTRCVWMARSMDIHRLDTAKSREERGIKGWNMVEVEVQRRIWWNLVATDWLTSFCGSVHDGIYTFHPKHMNVKYPSNADDESILPTEVSVSLLSEPTSMSAFIYRVKLAEICREVIDAMPSVMLEAEEADYDTILALDRRFQDHLDCLPIFFKIDPESIQQSQKICTERPYIAWQRITINLSIHTRLCRLHRPFHLEGLASMKYAYSREVCVRSAQTVLDLRHLMDEACAPVGLKPARFWIVVQHVFLAALVLATDVSFNASAADAVARKAKVLAAYQILETSVEESCGFREILQKNLRTLMSTLERPQPMNPSSGSKPRASTGAVGAPRGSLPSDPIRTDNTDTGEQNSVSEAGPWEENWEQLWSEFLEVAPDLDFSQWDALLEGTDPTFGTNFE